MKMEMGRQRGRCCDSRELEGPLDVGLGNHRWEEVNGLCIFLEVT